MVTKLQNRLSCYISKQNKHRMFSSDLIWHRKVALVLICYWQISGTQKVTICRKQHITWISWSYTISTMYVVTHKRLICKITRGTLGSQSRRKSPIKYGAVTTRPISSYPSQRPPLARPYGWDMRCFMNITLDAYLLQSSSYHMQYDVMLDRAITALNCTLVQQMFYWCIFHSLP